MSDFFTYEPRVLWTVQSIRAATSEASLAAARVVVPPDELRNVGKYPITLTHMIVGGVGYAFRQLDVPDPVPAPAAGFVQNSMSAPNLLEVLISAPYSQYFYRKDMPLMAWHSVPHSTPGMFYSAVSYASSLWGMTRWDFPRPLRLPRKSTIQFDVSAWNVPGLQALAEDQDAFLAVSFEEAHTGMFNGNNRHKERVRIPIADPGAATAGSPWYPQAGPPVPMDGWGAVAGEVPDTFPAAGRFRADVWNRQESDRGQRDTHYTGFGVMIDQISYDEAINALGGNFANQPVAPLSQKVATRARVTDGGSGQWWWRPGAPLSLVCPTINNAALVQELIEPIVLGPGERLEVELQAPVGGTFNTAASSVAQQIRPYFNLGLSFCGYATIQ